jgi:putative flippase GtrA
MPSGVRANLKSAAFLRYCAVGTIGYLVDLGMTLLLMSSRAMSC